MAYTSRSRGNRSRTVGRRTSARSSVRARSTSARGRSAKRTGRSASRPQELRIVIEHRGDNTPHRPAASGLIEKPAKKAKF